MNTNHQETKTDSSAAAQLAGFAPPASRGDDRDARSSTVSTATSGPSAQSDGNRNSGGSHINNNKKNANAASVAAESPTTAVATAKKRPAKKSSSKAASAAGGAGEMSSNNSDDSALNYNEDATVQPLMPISSSTFKPMTLSQIQLRIKLLLDKLPVDLPDTPPNYIDEDSLHYLNYYPPIKSFASSLQIIIEEYNFLLGLVAAATYQWGVDRSGASQQNLSVMSSELQQCQEVITSVVSGRLSNVLCPAVDVLVGHVEIVRNDDEGGGRGGGGVGGKKRKLEATYSSTTTTELLPQPHNTQTATKTADNEKRINHYTRPQVDPSYVHLCHQIVARNGEMLRYTIATCIHTAQCVIGDYLKAMKKDIGHDVGKGGYY